MSQNTKDIKVDNFNTLDVLSYDTLKNNSEVQCTDEEGDLRNFCYRAEIPSYEVRKIRGLVVSVDHPEIGPVSDSYGYTPRVYSSNLVEKDGELHLTDDNDRSYIFDVDTTVMNVGFDGTFIRVFKWNGKIHVSFHRRLNSDNSTWSNGSETFREIYDRLGGPTTELFGDKPYSPYTHYFILSDKQLTNCNKFPIDGGVLVYLGNKQVWDPEKLNVDNNLIDNHLRVPKTSGDIDSVQPFIYKPEYLDLEQANKHLKYGWSTQTEEIENLIENDERLGPGEFVVLYGFDNLSKQQVVLRLHSTAYQFRELLNPGYNNNYYCQFCRWVNLSYRNWNDYDYNLPVVKPYSLSFLKNLIERDGYIRIWPENGELSKHDLNTRDGRLYHLLLLFLNCVPLFRQKYVIEYYDQFFKDRKELLNWICSIERLRTFDTLLQICGEKKSRRIIQIIQTARMSAHSDFDRELYEEKQKPFKQRKRLFPVHLRIRSNIKNMIYNEGIEKHHRKDRLYQMFTTMNTYYKQTMRRLTEMIKNYDDESDEQIEKFEKGYTEYKNLNEISNKLLQSISVSAIEKDEIEKYIYSYFLCN